MADSIAHREGSFGPAATADAAVETASALADLGRFFRLMLAAIASLRVTVVLFVLSLVIVLAGTLAQRFAGIDTVLEQYFRSLYVWIPFQIFFPTSIEVPGHFLFFGGWLLGGALLTNLLAAHAVRLQISWKRSGILLLHAGIVVMMLSEFITGMFAVEGNMTIAEGETVNFVDESKRLELAIVDRSDPQFDEVVVIPESLLRRGGLIRHELLPVDVEVVRYMVNSTPHEQSRMLVAIVPHGDRTWFFKVVGSHRAVEQQKEAFDRFVRSLRFADDSARPVTWTVPEGWHEHGPAGTRYSEFHLGPESANPPVLTVTPLGRDAGTLIDNVNRWSRVTQQLKVGDATAVIVDLFDEPQQNLATAGDGLEIVAKPVPEVSGTDPNQTVDASSAYVTFKKKDSGESLGTYLVSLWFYSNFTRRQMPDRPQHFTVDGKEYEAMLRFKRSYKDYSLHLADFNHDLYIGTDKPKDFSSHVRLTDPTRNENREVRIWMNHPLRHAGETFYQSAWIPGDTGTVLQVVRNPGWLMPYISCGMVGVGMLIHFCMGLYTFLRRSAEKAAGRVTEPAGFALWVPAAAIVLSAAYLVSQMRPRTTDDAMRIDEFARLPVVADGRVKPLDTLARNTLMVISERQTFRDENGDRQPAIRWLLDVMTYQLHADDESRAADKHRVFRIEDLDVLDALGLERRPGSWRYALGEFKHKIDLIGEQARQADVVAPEKRTLYQAKIIELAQHLTLFTRLAGWETPLAVPPEEQGGEWHALVDAIIAARRGAGGVTPSLRAWGEMLKAYADNDAAAFNKAVADYRRDVDLLLPAEMGKVDFEEFFNRFAPFVHCSVLYVAVFGAGCLAWLATGFGWVDWAATFRRTAYWLPMVTLVVHTFALGSRMYLMDRPFVFVTNLYSSAVFIGWGTVILGVVLERIFRNSIGSVISGVTGFLSLVIAHNLARSGDTLEMMQAVLDTNFWLATHVTCITAGYAATFVAGFLGIVFVVVGVFTPWADKEAAKTLGRMIYGVACFATLLSFVGTVLGGIWADQSWGRFWGWDPKENGALMIVIWNALILHARWGGLVRERGLAVLAILGNVVTAWSWFGTNQLGVGLHSYGFINAVAMWLIIFKMSQLALVGLGLMPKRLWRSE